MDINTTLQQLGGIHKLRAMIAANTFIKRGDDSFSFRFKGSRKANYLIITLNKSDLYDLSFGKVRSPNFHYVKKYTDIGCDQLVKIFEAYTGLYLSL